MENKVWVTSDWHFNHDKEFIWKPRGFSSVQEMNEELVRRHNEVVGKDDTVFVLGDLMMGPYVEDGLAWITKMNGNKMFVRGNHDTDNRMWAYVRGSVVNLGDAHRKKYHGYNLFMCHYPVLTANFDKSLKACTINLYGHTHQQNNFYNEMPWMYHVGVDSHNCYPVSLDDIIKEIKDKVEECKTFL